MPDLTNDLPDDQDDTLDDGAGDNGGQQGGTQGVTLEQLQAKIDSLEATNTKTSRDLIAAVGRLQALQSKVDAGTGDSGTVTALKAQMAAASDILDALLEDETVDPKVKERANSARAKAQKAQADSELETLRREIEELKKPRAAAVADTDGPTPFEAGIVLAINAAGLDPDDTALFDWKGEASVLLHQQGPAAATAYFRKKIEEGLAAKATANRRQTRKDAGSTQTKPQGDATNPLDPSRPAEERLKYLMAQGHIS